MDSGVSRARHRCVTVPGAASRALAARFARGSRALDRDARVRASGGPPAGNVDLDTHGCMDTTHSVPFHRRWSRIAARFAVASSLLLPALLFPPAASAKASAIRRQRAHTMSMCAGTSEARSTSASASWAFDVADNPFGRGMRAGCEVPTGVDISQPPDGAEDVGDRTQGREAGEEADEEVPSAGDPAKGSAGDGDPQAVSCSRWESWLEAFREEARGKGVSEETIHGALRVVRPPVEPVDGTQGADEGGEDAGVAVETDGPRDVMGHERSQPENVQRLGDYVFSRVPGRIARGRALMWELRDTLHDIESAYGVPKEILVAVWGLESDFGAFSGDFPVLESLLHLAYLSDDAARGAFFRDEALCALQIVERGVARAQDLVGSWAGAMGQCQFMPSAFLRCAVDHDGDGRPDIWASQADALASIAQFLKSNGWEAGRGFGSPVVPPSPDTLGRFRHKSKAPVSEWVRRGFGLDARSLADSDRPLRVFGSALGPQDVAELVAPFGPSDLCLLAGPNWRAVMSYNPSTNYAASVCWLACELRGADTRPPEGLRRVVSGGPFRPHHVAHVRAGADSVRIGVRAEEVPVPQLAEPGVTPLERLGALGSVREGEEGAGDGADAVQGDGRGAGRDREGKAGVGDGEGPAGSDEGRGGMAEWLRSGGSREVVADIAEGRRDASGGVDSHTGGGVGVGRRRVWMPGRGREGEGSWDGESGRRARGRLEQDTDTDLYRAMLQKHSDGGG